MVTLFKILQKSVSGHGLPAVLPPSAAVDLPDGRVDIGTGMGVTGGLAVPVRGQAGGRHRHL